MPMLKSTGKLIKQTENEDKLNANIFSHSWDCSRCCSIVHVQAGNV